MAKTPDKAASSSALVRAVGVFVLVLTIFIVIEILPHHFGPRNLPFDQLGAEVRNRLPRILFIAVAVSLFITTRKPGQRRPE